MQAAEGEAAGGVRGDADEAPLPGQMEESAAAAAAAASKAAGIEPPAPAAPPAPPMLRKTGSFISSTESVADPALSAALVEVPQAGRRLFVWSLAGSLALVAWAAMLAVVARRAWAVADATASDEAASWFRVLEAALSTLPEGIVLTITFAYAFSMQARHGMMAAAATSLVLTFGFALDEWAWEGDDSRQAALESMFGYAMQTIGSSVLPGLFAYRFGTRRPELDSPERPVPWMRAVFVFTTVFGMCLGSPIEFMSDNVAFIAVNTLLVTYVVLISAALVHDQPASRYVGDFWYCCLLVSLLSLAPTMLAQFSAQAFLSLDSNDPRQAAGAAVLFSLFLWWINSGLFGALSARCLAPQNGTVVQFPIQLFAAIFIDFLFSTARVFSGSYFVLLVLGMVKTLVRDTGTTSRVMRAAAARLRGVAAPAETTESVAVQMRRLVQFASAETLGVMVFLGVLCGEAWDGAEVGIVTDQDASGRGSMAAGFVVILAAEWLVFGLCAVFLGRQSDGVAVVPLAEALIRTHWVFFAMSVLFVSGTAVSWIAYLRVDERISELEQ